MSLVVIPTSLTFTGPNADGTVTTAQAVTVTNPGDVTVLYSLESINDPYAVGTLAPGAVAVHMIAMWLGEAGNGRWDLLTIYENGKPAARIPVNWVPT